MLHWIVALISVAALVGCDGFSSSDNAEGTTTVALSKDEFIGRADAICAKYLAEEQPLRDQLPRDDSPDAFRQVAALLPQLATSLRRQVGELRTLNPPANDREQWKATLDLVAKSADKLNEGAEAAARFNRDEFARIAAEALVIEQQTAALAAEYGFEVCGSRASRPAP